MTLAEVNTVLAQAVSRAAVTAPNAVVAVVSPITCSSVPFVILPRASAARNAPPAPTAAASVSVQMPV